MVINFVVLSNIHIYCNVTCRGVEGFPEQNPIDSGTILQTIQRIDYLVLSTFTNFVYITLRHVTTKFAHMNGHWKGYDCINVLRAALSSLFFE